MLLICNLHLVLIYIFMMSNEVGATFRMFIGYLDILFCGYLLTQIFCFCYLAIFFLLVCREWLTVRSFYFNGGEFCLVLIFILKFIIH